jgi:hypothetical protein
VTAGGGAAEAARLTGAEALVRSTRPEDNAFVRRFAPILAIAGLALLAPGPAASAVKIGLGRLAPDGVARVSASLPRGKRFRPASIVLSKNARFGTGDVKLGSSKAKGTRTFRVWVSLPDEIAPGSYKMLACRRAKPSAGGCVAVGSVTVHKPLAIPVATPERDASHVATGAFGLQGGTLDLVGADGTDFKLTVPVHSVPDLSVTMTAVTALNPARAVGRLVTGVMIEPLGTAPPGTTLTIHRPSWPAHASTVAFGGADPSGGAFPLAVKVGTTTTIPLTSFGGYGVAVSTSGGRAAQSVPCTRPGPKHFDAGRRPLMSCYTEAERIRALGQTAFKAAQAGQVGEAELAFEATANDVNAEIDAIIGQDPTYEAAASLIAMQQMADSIERQATLLGYGEAAAGLALGGGRLAKYQYKLAKSVCFLPGSRPSGIYIAALFDVISAERNAELNGLEGFPDLQTVLSRCSQRILIRFTAHDDATTDTGGQFGFGAWTGHVIIDEDFAIRGTPDLRLDPDPPGTAVPSLNFTEASSTADPAFAALGGSVQTISAIGDFNLTSIAATAKTDISCDKNRKLQIKREYSININSFDLWNDAEQIQLFINGIPSNTDPDATADFSWSQDYRSREAPRISIKLDGPDVHRANSGTCSGIYCETFAYDVNLGATQLVN